MEESSCKVLCHRRGAASCCCLLCLPCVTLLWCFVGLSAVLGGGSLAQRMTMRLYHQLSWRRLCSMVWVSCATAVVLLVLAMYSMPGTFNMRVIPTIQEFNAMFIITSATMTCDTASLPGRPLEETQYPIPSWVKEDQFTIILNTFQRTDLLLQSLKHYSVMKRVSKIVVYWSNVDAEPPDLSVIVQSIVPIVIKRMPATNISLRFSPSEHISTQGQ